MNPNPTREEAAFAIRNNICRCTGYVKIIDAILLAAELLPGGRSCRRSPADWSVGQPGAPGGRGGEGHGHRRVPRRHLPGRHALRQRRPLASTPGPGCWPSTRRRPGPCPAWWGSLRRRTSPGKNKVGHLEKDWDTMIAVGDITHYLGDAICLVAAETPEILAQAKALVKVDYEELPTVRSPQEAMAAGRAPGPPDRGTCWPTSTSSRGNAGGGHRQVQACAHPALLTPPGRSTPSWSRSAPWPIPTGTGSWSSPRTRAPTTPSTRPSGMLGLPGGEGEGPQLPGGRRLRRQGGRDGPAPRRRWSPISPSAR